MSLPLILDLRDVLFAICFHSKLCLIGHSLLSELDKLNLDWSDEFVSHNGAFKQDVSRWQGRR